MRGICTALALLGLVGFAGCAPRIEHWSYGPYPPTPHTLDVIAAAVATVDLVPEVDRVHGVVRAAEGRPCRSGGTAIYVVRVYQQGWVELAIDGTCARDDGDGWLSEGRVVVRARRLALALRSALDGGSAEAAQ